MRAVLITQFGEPADVLEVGEAPKPEPGPGQVRVRMLASPVNPSDLLTVRGRYGLRPQLPAIPGFEGVGVIDAAGPGWVAWLRGFRPGVRVAVLSDRGGNWADHVVLPARQAVPVGDLPDAQAATFFVNPATAYVMTRQVLRVPRGELLLQTAAGSSLARMVRRLGQKYGFRVLNVVRRPEQAEELRREGHLAVAGTDEGLADAIRQANRGGGVKYAIDAVGGATALGVVQALAPGGRLLLYGVLADQPISLHPRLLMWGNASVEGFWLAEWARRQSVPTMLRLFSRITGLLKEGVLASDVEEFPLEKVREAVRQAETPGLGRKVLLRVATA